MVNPFKSIMKKIISIVLLQLFISELALGQSSTDFQRLKKQYESLLQSQDDIKQQSDLFYEDDEIITDLPIKIDLELKKDDLEKAMKEILLILYKYSCVWL